MNRWQALVEIVRLLVNTGKPNLAFASVCIFLIPSVAMYFVLIFISQDVEINIHESLPSLLTFEGETDDKGG
jgi:hypothetical protein